MRANVAGRQMFARWSRLHSYYCGIRPFIRCPDGLTSRAEQFIRDYCHWFDLETPPDRRRRLLERGIPEEQVDRYEEYDRRWGGLVLPPAPLYDEGPWYLAADCLEPSPEGGWRFESGLERTSGCFGFEIGPNDEFAVRAHAPVALHESVEGWIEAMALAYDAVHRATRISRIDREEVDLDGFEPVPEVRGVTDTWWRRGETLVAVHTGVNLSFCMPLDQARVTRIYEGVRR
ncbi:hypothetical protein [Lentzea cavernae]|nr:hypothetical protein [Lentzea cavernae]